MLALNEKEYNSVMQLLDRLDAQLQVARQIPMEGFRRVTNPYEDNHVFRVGDFIIMDTKSRHD